MKRKLLVVLIVLFFVNAVAIAGPVHDAVRNRNIDTLRQLVAENPELLGAIEERDANEEPEGSEENEDDHFSLQNHKTPFGLAIELGFDDVAQWLMDFCSAQGLDPVRALGLRYVNDECRNLIEVAMISGRTRVLGMLLNAHVDFAPNLFDTDNLFASALYFNEEGSMTSARFLLKYCVTHGLDAIAVLGINHLGGDGVAAIHWAAENGHADVIGSLIRLNGIQLDLRERGGNTAMHLAVEHNHGEVLAVFLGREAVSRALVNIPNYAGLTPLHIAAMNGSGNLARILINEGGANMNLGDEGGLTPLGLAKDNLEVCEEVYRSLQREIDSLQGAETQSENNTKKLVLLRQELDSCNVRCQQLREVIRILEENGAVEEEAPCCLGEREVDALRTRLHLQVNETVNLMHLGAQIDEELTDNSLTPGGGAF